MTLDFEKDTVLFDGPARGLGKEARRYFLFCGRLFGTVAGGVFRDRFPARGKERKYAEREIDEIYGWQKRRGSAGEDEPVGCADSDDYHDVYPSVVGISVGAGGIDLLLFPYDEQEHFQALSGESAFSAENL